MAIDAIVMEQAGTQSLEIDMRTLVQLAPMQPGRSYVVWAMGTVVLRNALAAFELEAFDAKASTRIATPERASALMSTTFSLTVATTLPADDDVFTTAKLSGNFNGLGGAGPAAVVENVKLVVLAVDSVTIQ